MVSGIIAVLGLAVVFLVWALIVEHEAKSSAESMVSDLEAKLDSAKAWNDSQTKALQMVVRERDDWRFMFEDLQKKQPKWYTYQKDPQ